MTNFYSSGGINDQDPAKGLFDSLENSMAGSTWPRMKKTISAVEDDINRSGGIDINRLTKSLTDLNQDLYDAGLTSTEISYSGKLRPNPYGGWVNFTDKILSAPLQLDEHGEFRLVDAEKFTIDCVDAPFDEDDITTETEITGPVKLHLNLDGLRASGEGEVRYFSPIAYMDDIYQLEMQQKTEEDVDIWLLNNYPDVYGYLTSVVPKRENDIKAIVTCIKKVVITEEDPKLHRYVEDLLSYRLEFDTTPYEVRANGRLGAIDSFGSVVDRQFQGKIKGANPWRFKLELDEQNDSVDTYRPSTIFTVPDGNFQSEDREVRIVPAASLLSMRNERTKNQEFGAFSLATFTNLKELEVYFNDK